MSVPIHIITIEATNDEGDLVQVKLEGLTAIPSEEDVDKAKKAAADLFEWGFGEEPYEIHVHDSMKHRAARDDEEDEDAIIDRPAHDEQSYAERQEAERNIGFQDMADHRAAWPCSDCGHYNHPDRTICAKCGHDTLGDA